MNNGVYLYCGLLFCLLSACYSQQEKQKKPLYSYKSRSEFEIDSLLAIERNDIARKKIWLKLMDTDSADYASMSFLWNRLGKSYQLSYHFDSAVYYIKMAYDLSLRLNEKQRQVIYGANLLSTYNKSANYTEEQKQIFQALQNLDVSEFPVPVLVLVQNALVEYYQKKLIKLDAYGVVLKNEYNSYISYSKNHILTHEDSTNMALSCIYLSRAYTFKNFMKPLIASDSGGKTDDERIYYLRMARKWIGNKTEPLASYYLTSIHVSFIEDNYDTKRSALYLDSLINLKKGHDLNLNDMIIRGHVYFGDNHFFYLDNNRHNNLIIREICKRAEEYNHHLIDSSVTYYLRWLEADLLLREKKYDSALKIYNDIIPYLSKNVQLRQQMSCIHSVAACYEGLGMKDSIMVYFELYSQLSDRLINIDENRTIKATDLRYQNKLKEDKINLQRTIIEYTNRQRLLFLAATIFAIAFIALLIVLYRKLDRRRRALQHLNLKLDEANKTKAKLFAIISHDFRSPVNQVYQLLQLQRSKDIVIHSDEKAELEKQTQAAAANLLESMEQLLMWSKTQMESFNIVNEKVDIYDVCRQCTDLLHTIIQSRQLQISLKVLPGCIIETDPNFLLAIVRNILQNAIKASPEHAEIIIRYEAGNKKHPCIRILNQGPPFTQQDYLDALADTSRLLKGGLGLLIVDELSKKIGARILFGREGVFTYCNILFETQ